MFRLYSLFQRWTLFQSKTLFQPTPSGTGRRWNGDFLLTWTLRGAACITGLIVALILVFLVRESSPALAKLGVARFFTDGSWHPAAGAEGGTFLMLPMIWGTLSATLGAVLVATPLGLASAVFCRFYAPTFLARPYRRMIELLAGIPSVVYGFWGLVVLVPWIRRLEPPGPSLLAGIAVLAIMILPTVALTSEAALAAVPRAHLQAAVALGLSRGRTLWSVVLPAARSGILTGVLLQTARALGETMAVLMVCGNIVRTPSSIFDPIRTLTANIALEMAYAVGDHRAALFVSGLLLLGLVSALVWSAERWTGRAHG